MGTTLNMTSLSQYYTLVDIATYCAMEETLDLEIAYENQDELINQYGVIKVDPSLHNRDDSNADLFYDWLIRSDIQVLISQYIICDLQLLE